MGQKMKFVRTFGPIAIIVIPALFRQADHVKSDTSRFVIMIGVVLFMVCLFVILAWCVWEMCAFEERCRQKEIKRWIR